VPEVKSKQSRKTVAFWPGELRPGRGLAVVGPLLLLQLFLWVGFFGVTRYFQDGPSGTAMGTDFAVFVGASNAMKHGQNPYDSAVLFRSESSLLARQHLRMTGDRFNVRAGNPPLFYWALEPLTGLPFQRVAVAWILAMYLSSGAGFLLALRYLRWTNWLLPTVVFLLMPEVVTGATFGNVHGPVLVVIALCLVLMERHAGLAGAVGALGWLKPQIAFPLLLVIFLFHSVDRRRAAAGFLGATVALSGAMVAATGLHSFAEWIAGLDSWSNGIGKEPNVVSLSGLYSGWLPRSLQIVVAIGLVVLACGATTVAWKRVHSRTVVPVIAVGWLWVLWFLVSPFAHYTDVIVLAVPVLALLGRNGEHVARPLGIATLYLAFFSLVVLWTPLVSLPVIVLGILLGLGANREAADGKVRMSTLSA
jgi:Glycosyltransferase family 87